MNIRDLCKGVTYTVLRDFADADGKLVAAGTRLIYDSQACDVGTKYCRLRFKERNLRLTEDAHGDLFANPGAYFGAGEHQDRGVRCPNCGEPMAVHLVELFYRPHPVEVDACAACHLLWLDQSEAVAMTPRSVLNLFHFLKDGGAPIQPIGRKLQCVRCTTPLTLVQDIQRTSRFNYWRCPADHGGLYTFTQFLRQKNFLRSPSSDDLARLKKLVRQIACAQCGAPVDLQKESVCSHCGSAIVLIDPDGIAKAVHELGVQDGVPPSAATEAQTRAAIIMAEHQALEEQRRRAAGTGSDAIGDLIDAGMSALRFLLK